MIMFTGDAKRLKQITDVRCCKKMLPDSEKKCMSNQIWKLNFNASKWSFLETEESEKKPLKEYTIGIEKIKLRNRRAGRNNTGQHNIRKRQ